MRGFLERALAKAGYELIVYNRTRSKADAAAPNEVKK